MSGSSRGFGRAVRASAALEATDFRTERRGDARQDLRVPHAPCGRRAALDDLQPEAFALVREAAQRVLKMRHFDVQLIGGLALHQGKIAEMRTGEGKTLVATLPAYLNALAGAGRARGHGQRIPGAARRRLDGPDLQVPRPVRRRDQEPAGLGREARRLRLRHHLRHQQRVRLRLPARQPGVPARGPGAAPASPTRSSTRSTRS